MEKYHKIQSVFYRDPDKNYKTFIAGKYSTPEFEYLADANWVWTEKIDGTNIRVNITESGVRFGGRTDNAQIPAHLLEVLQDTFPNGCIERLEGPVTLYGEGYGQKIQKGGDYLDGVGFILFDVSVNGVWLEYIMVKTVAAALGIPHVPVIGSGTLAQAVDFVSGGIESVVAKRLRPAEGIVLRPARELRNARGDRIIAKLKVKDFRVPE